MPNKDEIRAATIERLMRDGHGMVAMPDNLGIMVASRQYAPNCPAGWVFVDSETMTRNTLRQAFEAAEKGRKNWPPKPE